VAVIPAGPAAAVLLAAIAGWAVGARWARGAAGAVALGALGWVLATRALWEADVRRGVYIASRARGLWLDRGVALAMAASMVAMAAGLRGSRAGFGVAGVMAAGAMACAWAAG
jgi:hypothetical protein